MPAVPQPEAHDYQRLHSKLATLLRVCQRINSERDLGTLLDYVAREAASLLEADRASIFLLDERKQQLWSKVALGSDEIISMDARSGIAGGAATTGQVINVADAYADTRFNAAVDEQTGFHTANLLAVPLRKIDGEIIGAFEVLNARNGAFSREDEELLQSLAAQAAIAIQTAQFVGELKRSHDELVRENAHLWQEVQEKLGQRRLIGTSPAIQGILRLIERIRDNCVSVLITGESGTGKELVARAIHYTSPRSRRPFVALNCAALPDALVESELFGIERGVATGVQPRAGHFQEAHGGTLFLDEIGDLSLAAQAKILRALQEQVFERVGGRSPISVDVRLITATNRDLAAEIRKGTFREDLYYRLKVIHIQTPPLRDMREDIPNLVHHFLAEACREMKKRPVEITPEAVQRLKDAPWPGNVRQLQNEIKRLVASAGNVISAEDLEEGAAGSRPAAQPSAQWQGKTLKTAAEELERNMIAEALRQAGGNQGKAARALGLSRQGLLNKLQRHGISPSTPV